MRRSTRQIKVKGKTKHKSVAARRTTSVTSRAKSSSSGGGSSLSSGASASSSCHSGSDALASQLSQLLDMQKRHSEVLLTLQRASSVNALPKHAPSAPSAPREQTPPTRDPQKRSRDKKKAQKREKKLKKKLKKMRKRMKAADNIVLYPHHADNFVPQPPPPRAVRRPPPRRIMGYRIPRHPFMRRRAHAIHIPPPLHSQPHVSHSPHQEHLYDCGYTEEEYY